jgi:hypothetical protein
MSDLVKVFPNGDTITVVRKPKAIDMVNKFVIEFYDHSISRQKLWTIFTPVMVKKGK